MELRSLQSPCVSCSIPRSGFLIQKNPFLNGHFIKVTNSKIYPDAKKLTFFNFTARASVTARSSSVLVEAIPQGIDSKDENIVFVAGATGKVGSRTVRELLKLGCKVRAGVRSIQKAENLVKSVRQMKLDEGADKETQRKRRELLEHHSTNVNAIELIDVPAIKKLELVECDLEKKNEIGPAIANASIVICCIGASEKEISDITGPYRIDYLATKNLIDAATAAKVNHFILVTSLGTNKFGFPAAILNLFWGVLCWKRKAEEALLASGIPYTIVRPGGMERPTDSYKETHNLTLSLEDTLFGSQVSNLQVAELLAFMAKNRSLSYCKVVEVIAETTAPLTPMGKLLEKIPPQRVEVSPRKEPPSAADGPATSAPTEKKSTISKKTVTRPLSPYYAYTDLKPPTSPCPTAPANVKVAVALTPNVVSATEPDPPVVEIVKGRPLSPYAAYADLKPPCSPCPTPSGPKEAPSIVSANAEPASLVQKDPPPLTNYCHSPFAAYADLKPPCSPCPTPSGPKEAPSIVSANTEPASLVQKDPPPLTNYCHSPFAAYEDLKPPTSPCPTPSGPKETPSVVSAVAASDTTMVEIASVVQNDPPPLTNSCHSPFTAYEDLKPPTFPTAPQKK